MTNKKIIELLNKLIEINFDTMYLYRTAARNIDEEKYKIILTNYSEKKEKYLAQLREKVLELNGEVERIGSLNGLLRRGWTDLVSILARNGRKAVISECIKMEKSSLSIYEETIKNNLPEEIKKIVEFQIKGIEERIDRLKNFNDQGFMKEESKDKIR